MHSRRPLPALALVMPHPQLPTRSSLSHLPAPSPHTPRACTPSTPILFHKQFIASPRTSTDSWGSSNGKGEDDVHWEWKPDQTNLLIRTLDAVPGHLYTPFNGPVPPSNLLDKIARSVSQAQGPLEWPHSIRATRAKLVEIARTRDKDRNKENMTIDEQDEEGVVEVPPARQPKKPLYRQSSMDFLPSRDKGNGSVSRLSSRLQRTDRIIQAYHPYARPASRSPSPPILTPRSEVGERFFFPTTPTFAPSIPQRSLRPRTSSNSLGSRPSQPLRRSASTMSTHSNPIPSSTVVAPMNVGVLTPIKPAPVARAGLVRRSDSYAAPIQPTLKRAPSFGATSIVSGVSTPKQLAAEKQPQDPESDDEEKVRQKKAKRACTRSTHANTLSNPEKKREKKSEGMMKDAVSKAVKSTSKSRPQQRLRSGSMFGVELPQSLPSSSLPTASPKPLSPSTVSSPHRASASPPPSTPLGTKTLRRVKTTAFNLGSCPTARRISFGSLAGPTEEEQTLKSANASTDTNSGAASALGSAFQMS